MKYGKRNKIRKWVIVVSFCIMSFGIWCVQKISKYQDGVERTMEGREDNLIYLARTDIFGYDVNEMEESSLRLYDLVISYRVYSNGSFARTDMKDFGSAKHYKIRGNDESYTKRKYFQTKPVSGIFNEEFCQKHGIELENFEADIDWQTKNNRLWNITLWDEYVLLFGADRSDGYIGRVFNKQGIEQELISKTEYNIGCDNIQGAEFVNKPIYFFDQKKEELHIFYKNEYGIFLRILTTNVQ